MKKYKILSAALATAVLSGASAMAQFNYQSGDMIAAFGNGGSTDVIVDLGSISQFQNTLTAPFSYNLNSVLTSQFGSVNSSVYWAVFGVNDGGASGISQTDPNTVWTTLARFNPAIKSTTPHVGGNSTQQQLAVQDIGTIGNLTVPSGAGPGQIVDYAPGIELVKTSQGGFSPMMNSPFNGDFQGDWVYNVLNNGVSLSDLYQSDPGNRNVARANYLGNFGLGSDGTLTFSPVPEPSTWAMIGSGALALLALRRRNHVAK
jgi:hypothetical protein